MWDACLADPYRGIAFFDGIRIDTDRLTDPRWNRVLPVFEDEQIVMCRAMRDRGYLAKGVRTLDVGTGCGVFAIWAAAHGCHVIGIDVAARALRLAKLNRLHRSNDTRINDSGGVLDAVTDLRRVSIEDFAASSPAPFDLIFLSPAYNPTVPGVEAAFHARGAGNLGLDVLHRQLPLAFRLLKPGGTIVGNQLVFHQSGFAAEWWTQEMSQATGHDIGWSVHYAHILPGEYRAEDFLRAEYRLFTNPLLRLTPSSKDVESYLARLREYKDPVFTYQYYEVQKHALKGGQQTGDICQIELRTKPPSDWPTRIGFHRTIVEHTSGKNRYPAPSIYLVNGFSPAPPSIRFESVDATGKAELSTVERLENSPFDAVIRWIEQARFFEGPSAFKFVLIDAAPWYESWGGGGDLPNDVLLCEGKQVPLKRDLHATLQAYQLNVRGQQLARVGPFLHPLFTGQLGASEWGTIYCRVLDGIDLHEDSIDARDRDRWQQWIEAIKTQAELVPSQDGALTLQSIGTKGDAGGLTFDYAYSSERLQALETPTPDQVFERIARELGIDFSCRTLSSELPTEQRSALIGDIDLCYMVYHRRLREVCAVPTEQKTALIGVPLRMAFAKESLSYKKLPETFRGGLFFFAGLGDNYGPLEESKLFDLVRLSNLLEMSYVDARASHALAAHLQRDYHSDFTHEIKDVIEAIAPGTPGTVLDGIRGYFSLIALKKSEFDRRPPERIWQDVCGLYPRNFAHGATWHSFLSNHLQIALHMRQMLSAVRRLASPIGTAISEPLVHWIPDEDVQVAPDYQSIDKRPPKRIQELCFFSLAVVTALRNIMTHSNPEDPDIYVEYGTNQVRITNRRHDARSDMQGTGLSHIQSGRAEGTEGVLRRYAQHYRQDYNLSVHLGPLGPCSWVTEFPVPEGFWLS